MSKAKTPLLCGERVTLEYPPNIYSLLANESFRSHTAIPTVRRPCNVKKWQCAFSFLEYRHPLQKLIFSLSLSLSLSLPLSLPDRGRSPVEWGDFPSICPPPPEWAGRPSDQVEEQAERPSDLADSVHFLTYGGSP